MTAVSNLGAGARRLARPAYGLLPASVRARADEVRARVRFARDEIRAVPPADLRSRVHGSRDISSFLATGRRCAWEIDSALIEAGLDPQRPLDVLDFGVGSARTLRYLRAARPHWRLSGSDIDDEALAWCRRHYPDVRLEHNDRHPPTAFAESSFDALYAISVLTHLDEADCLAWMKEFRRLLRPGGIAAVSVHGRDALRFGPAAQARLDEHGYVFIVDDELWNGVFPDWYQTSVHEPGYVTRVYGELLEVVEHRHRGLNGHQDLVLLRRRRPT